METEDVAVIRSSVQYAAPPKERLWFNANDRTSNIEYVDTDVSIHDARPLAGKTSIDREGFEVHTLTSRVTDWDDEDEVKRVYFQEAADFVKSGTGAKYVIVFDSTFRRVADPTNGGGEPRRAMPTARGAAKGVHNDFAAASALQRLDGVLGAGTSSRAGRFAIVNLWKPLVDTVYDVPLGLVDASTVSPADFTAYDLIFPDRVGQTLAVHANPGKHKWYYLPRQRRDEVFLFKQFDTDASKARFTPHSPFKDPTAPAESTFQPRESIELRLFVFYDTWKIDVSPVRPAS